MKTACKTSVFFVLFILFSIFTAGCGNINRETKNLTDIEKIFINDAEIIDSIKGGLKGHSERIIINFDYKEDILNEIPSLVDIWMDKSMIESDVPVEGDYIRYQLGGWESNSSYLQDNGLYSYRVYITPKYYMYLSQEEAVSGEVERLVEELDLKGIRPDYDKVKDIYDYICSNVGYDNFHRNNKYYFLRSTSWAALIKKSATCQGYAVAMYRLLKEAGIDCRIITGESKDDKLHAWNIIKLDGKYYYADATWDSVWSENSDWVYFLKGEESFSEYKPGKDFTEGYFAKEYPVSKEDYKS